MPRYVLRSILLAAVVPTAALAAECPVTPLAEGETLKLSRPVAGSVVREFGFSYDELAKEKAEHTGADLEAAAAEPVYAARAGTVTEAGEKAELGNYVRIDHGGGIETGYGHLATLAVKAGDCVTGGQEIGTAGATGVAPGPQLHFEVLRGGAAVDPLPLLE